jgi:phosphopantetheine--protein transferase-like protein
MIKGIGIDLIEICRFSEVSEDFLVQIFTTQEMEATKKKPLLTSITFCLKEAILKALGRGLYFGFFWHNIGIIENRISISGPLKKYLPGRNKIHTSTGNSKEYACAISVIEEKQEVF